MKNSTWKKIFFTIGVLCLIIFGIIFYIGWSTRPTPDNKRNISETDSKIEVELNDIAENRAPIIRTFKENDYNRFDRDKIKELMSTISGNIEGDIPAVQTKDDKNIIYISFFKNKKIIEPDEIPDIEIEVPEDSADTAHYTIKNNRIINDKLIKENGNYSYKIERYRTQNEKYFMDYNIIKISYQIDGNKYISIFGLNTSNADEDTDFFENDDLEDPIELEL